MRAMIPVVLCTDSNFLDGLHVTLFSMLKAASGRLKIYLLHKDIAGTDLALIEKTCCAGARNFQFIPIQVSDERFRNFRPLVGNTFAYAKLIIPEYVPDSRAVYCDSDLLFMLDVREVFEQNLAGHSIGATAVQDLASALECNFFVRLGINRKVQVFNSGVLLLDLDKWRRNGTTEICFEFARRHSKQLLAADQTILNAVFRGEFAELDARYNHLLFPYSTRQQSYGDRIYHFIGAPKPWDPFGNLFHGHYALYADVLAHTTLPAKRLRTGINWRAVRRAVRLSRRYVNTASRLLACTRFG
jgi:lipopolysaccharide biosynthesis glycosyltransferase